MTRLWAFLFVSIILLVVAEGSSNTNNLRAGTDPNKADAGKSPTPRQSVIRRIYGPENAQVRKNVRLLEEKSQRSQTGLLGDPNHEVPYENHPYDKSLRRDLQTDDNATSSTAGTAPDAYQPLRIRFETYALDSMRNADNAAKIDFIKTEILTRTSNFWSQALSVVPVSGYLKISAAELESREYCGDTEFTKVPTEYFSTGVSETDLILFVSGAPSTRFCQDTTLAVAVACNFDQFDRPTAGAINVCLDRVTVNDDGTASDSIISDNVDVLVHEVAHVLGHSSNSYRFYYNPDTGEPRTPRPFEASTVTCVDDVERSLILPAENTMKFSQDSNGQRYAAIVTEKVRTVARNQFNCQSLEGAKLENQPTGSDSCWGDHWDEHDYYPESLTAVISPTTNIMSHLTLALFEDSGWYRANYTQGQMNPWGLNAGCDFVHEPCLIANANGTPTIPSYGEGYFCTDASVKGCAPALTHKLACSIVDYLYIQPQTLPASRFQYFANEPTLGGPRQADYCPVFGSSYGGLDVDQLACTDTSNADTLNIYSEVYGSDSQCITTDSGEGRCYRTACVKDEMVLQINIRGEWMRCEYDFQELDVRVGAGALPQTLVCPRLSSACPDLFCPFQCAGRGVCNYNNTVNGTIQPQCECFDPTDTSPGCSDSLLPTGDFYDNANDLFDNIQQDFFDPLVAVFVDPPDKWTTSSWAWAAGLLIVFLVMLLCICSAFWPESDKSKTFENISHRDASTRKDSPLKGSSHKKQSSSPRISTSPRLRSASSPLRPSPRISSEDQLSSLQVSTSQRQSSSSGHRSAASQLPSPNGNSSSNRRSPIDSGAVAQYSPSYLESSGSHRPATTATQQRRPTSPSDYHYRPSSANNYGRQHRSLSPTSADI